MRTVKKVTKKETKVKAKKADCCEQKVATPAPDKDQLDTLQKVIEHLKGVKSLRGFIVLVDEGNIGDGKARGLNSVCGDADVLVNLIANIHPELLKMYELKKTFKRAMECDSSDMDEMDKALKACLQLAKEYTD